MNTLQTLTTESFLGVLERLILSREWAVAQKEGPILLKKVTTLQEYTPLTAVVNHLTGIKINSATRLEVVQDIFMIPVYQAHQIVDAEDFSSGHNSNLHRRIQEIVAL